MFKVTITVEDQSQVEDLLAALSNAEEEGELDFAFGVQTRESVELNDCSNGLHIHPNDTFGNEGRN